MYSIDREKYSGYTRCLLIRDLPCEWHPRNRRVIKFQKQHEVLSTAKSGQDSAIVNKIDKVGAGIPYKCKLEFNMDGKWQPSFKVHCIRKP